jgi:pantothenate kinase-related protein Tda10
VAKHYLGDGVYVERKVELISLTTEDGDGHTDNHILLEPAAFSELARWVRQQERKLKQAKKAKGAR